MVIISIYDLLSLFGWWWGQDIYWCGCVGYCSVEECVVDLELCVEECWVLVVSFELLVDFDFVVEVLLDVCIGYVGVIFVLLVLLFLEDVLGSLEQLNLFGFGDVYLNWWWCWLENVVQMFGMLQVDWCLCLFECSCWDVEEVVYD